jgi:hypothetical protein
MEKNNNLLKIGVLSLCLTLFLSLSAQAKPGVPLTPKSKSKALSYSLVGTLAPVVIGIPFLGHGKEIGATNNVVGLTLGSLGLWCGPGMGHLYAANSGRLVSGMWIRGLAGVIAVSSLSSLDILDNDSNTGPVLGFLLGSTVVVVSTIYDIATTGKSVDRYNEQHGFGQLTLQPHYWPNHQAVGFSLAYRF